MNKELATKYSPKDMEDRLYALWIERGYFEAKPESDKRPFVISMPPPNITGRLHIGHALDCAIQDTLIRYKRMAGFDALYMPGTDHAAIATEIKIVEAMAEEGLTKEGIGREGFMQRAWAWNDDVGGVIIEQFKKMGISADWGRARFTMDEGLSDAVIEVFIRLYNEGLIYRGKRLINWCTHCKTSISDAEVDHEDKEGNLWHFKYPLTDGTGHIAFATTRPETMLGDVAIAVNPDDERYAHLVGKMVHMPIVARDMPIIADSYVKMDFGTGAVKITPAHDFNDFDMAARHDLPFINVLNDDGTINAFGDYQGLNTVDARKKIIAEMDRRGLFIKKEGIVHAVGTHGRCKTVVEPLNKLQWFVSMDALAKPAIEAYKNNELRIIPDRFGKIYLNWLENIRDWCISRQLWWGHRVPAYHCPCGGLVVSKTAPEACPKCGGGMAQDEDNLDTWFSSALWPFSVLGWPDKTKDFEKYYPNDTMVTAYDLIFFWVIRMVFSGLKQTGQLPFKDVLFHGIIRDEQGRKMSKSLGNGIDPLELIDNYGADALRLALLFGNSPGNDQRLYDEKVESARNFLNKIWNASRFVLMQEDDHTDEPLELNITDKWIISKANGLVKEVSRALDKYDLDIASTKIYDFVWDEFCDWYIEMVKPRLYGDDKASKRAALYGLKTVLGIALKLLHPYCPFITEELYTALTGENSIMISPWPLHDDNNNHPRAEEQVGIVKAAIRAIRNLRAEMNVPPSRRSAVIISSDNQGIRQTFETLKPNLLALAHASEITVTNKAEQSDDFVSLILPEIEILLPFAQLVDIEQERARLIKERDKAQKDVDFVLNRLNNQGFMAKAPQRVVEEEQEKLRKFQEVLTAITEQVQKYDI